MTLSHTKEAKANQDAQKTKSLPKIGFLYLDSVLRFFNTSNFRYWPNKIETVNYHWGNDKQRFINEVKRKKIDILIGNIPATAYETFREISRALPNVRFVPSLDAQFANKSKENVTHFCLKHDLPIPKTHIFYEKDEAMAFLKNTSYPKIIKKSYGPSNYGGYFVHKVDSYEEAVALLKKKKYYPVYVQNFVKMLADIRVMLIGHKPVCAFWRRPPEGEWLTNTSQGGSMDYQNVPKEALDIAVRASKAANAEYWACDIALGEDGNYFILECATAFAAFPYIRDWIGQYLMWLFSNEKFQKPNIPLYNWEELGKINSSLLRTMRHITFGQYTPSYDAGDHQAKQSSEAYQLLPVELKLEEEWPSEFWNFQDNYVSNKPRQEQLPKVLDLKMENKDVGLEGETEDIDAGLLQLTDADIDQFLDGITGIGAKLQKKMLLEMGYDGIREALLTDTSLFLKFSGLSQKKYHVIQLAWESFRVSL